MALGGGEIALMITAASAAAGAGTSYVATQNRNKAIGRSQRDASAAANQQAGQVRDAASLEAMKREQDRQRVMGRIRVAAAAAGTSADSGSYAALQDQNTRNAAIDLNIIRTNRDANIANVFSGRDATINSLAQGLSNSLIAAFNGGMSGAGSGLQIASLVPTGTPAEPPALPEADPSLSIGGAGGLPSYGGSRFT